MIRWARLTLSRKTADVTDSRLLFYGVSEAGCLCFYTARSCPTNVRHSVAGQMTFRKSILHETCRDADRGTYVVYASRGVFGIVSLFALILFRFHLYLFFDAGNGFHSLSPANRTLNMMQLTSNTRRQPARSHLLVVSGLPQGIRSAAFVVRVV